MSEVEKEKGRKPVSTYRDRRRVPRLYWARWPMAVSFPTPSGHFDTGSTSLGNSASGVRSPWRQSSATKRRDGEGVGAGGAFSGRIGWIKVRKTRRAVRGKIGLNMMVREL